MKRVASEALLCIPMTIDTQQLKTLLLDTGTLKKEELVKAEAKAAEEKIAFEEVLTREGLVSEDALAQCRFDAVVRNDINLPLKCGF